MFADAGNPLSRYLAANRALWDEWTTIHAKSAFYGLEAFKQGGVRLRAYEVEEVGDVAGKSLLHLQCHFGIDTLSWARLGAAVTGADFSPKAIDLARALATEVSLDARFVCSDILDLPRALDGEFDVVYTSRGVLGWLPDLGRWAQVIAHFLRPGGFFYISEVHPVAQVWDDEAAVGELRPRYPYFERPEPLALQVQGSYADRNAYVTQPIEYGWTHGLGEIVTAIAQAGLRVEFLHERPFQEWEVSFLEAQGDGTWRLPANWPGELPLSFSLKASKVRSLVGGEGVEPPTSSV